MTMIRGAVLLILVLGFCNVRAFGQVVATWTDSNGNWSNGTNWSTLTAPNNGGGTFYNAVINGTGSDTITFDASGTVVNSLTIGAGETFRDNGLAPTLTVGDLGSPVPGGLTNNGTINWGNGAALNLANGGVNNGVINLTGNASLVLNGQFENNGSLDVNHSSLTGSYNNIGTNNTANISSLVIENGSTATLSVIGTFNYGSGTTIVSNGSALNVGYINNYRSSFEVLSGSTVTSGGIDNTAGEVLIDNSTMNLTSYAPAGPAKGKLTVQNGGILNVNGNFDASNNAGFLQNIITAQSVANILGTLDNNLSTFTVDNSRLNVGGNVVNSGSIVLQNSAIGVIGESLDNEGGGCCGNGVVMIDHSVLTVQGNLDNGPAYTPPTFPSGTLTITDVATLDVLGNFNNGTGSQASTVTLGGGSTLDVAGAFTNNQLAVLMMSGTNDALNAQGLFTNAGSVTVGSLETLNANGGFTNSGGNVSVSSGGVLNTSNYSQSSGLTDVSGNLTSHSYSQAGGNTTIETGGKLSATTFTATGGTITVNGTLDPIAVEIGSGAGLQGNGTIIGNVVMEGSLMPGTAAAPGEFTIIGNYEQTDSGILNELIGSGSGSLLDVSGDVALGSDSLLQITLLDGYNPLGQTFDLMDYGSLVGEFSNGSTFWDDGYLWDIDYGAHGIDVTAVTTPEPSSLFLLGLGCLIFGAFVLERRAAQ